MKYYSVFYCGQLSCVQDFSITHNAARSLYIDLPLKCAGPRARAQLEAHTPLSPNPKHYKSSHSPCPACISTQGAIAHPAGIELQPIKGTTLSPKSVVPS